MPEKIPQSTTIRVPLQAYLAGTANAATGKTIAVTISKNGASYGNPSGGATNAAEIGNGSYYVDLSTTDTGTLGPLFVRGAVATIDDVIAIYTVAKATNGGWTALPDAAAEAAGGLYTRGTGAGQINQDANGRIDANVKTWISGAIPAVNVTGVPLVDNKYLLGTIYSTPTVAGIPNVNAKTWNDLATVELPLVPTTAGRKLDVSAGGEAGVDWANVGSPTTTLALTGTTIATTQKVDVETIKTQAVTCGAGVTVLASVGTAATSTAQTGDSYGRIGATGSSLTSLASAANLAVVAGYLDTEIAAILAIVGALPDAGALTTIQADLDNIQTRLPAALSGGKMDSTAIVSDKTGFKLAADGVDAIPVESGLNLRQSISIIGAESAGRLAGVGTGTYTFYAMGDPATVRIVATVDGTGRVSVTLTPPA